MSSVCVVGVNFWAGVIFGSFLPENPKKIAPMDAQDMGRRQTKQKHDTICVEHHYTQTNTNNVNKT